MTDLEILRAFILEHRLSSNYYFGVHLNEKTQTVIVTVGLLSGPAEKPNHVVKELNLELFEAKRTISVSAAINMPDTKEVVISEWGIL